MLRLADARRPAPSQSSYNFRTYFQRRSRDMFRSTLLPATQAASTSPYSKASDVTQPVSPSTLSALPRTPAPSAVTDEASLTAWYAAAKHDLAALRRAALTNQMYAGEKLVVERPRIITGGGGAGVEASVGGAGQPVDGNAK